MSFKIFTYLILHKIVKSEMISCVGLHLNLKPKVKNTHVLNSDLNDPISCIRPRLGIFTTDLGKSAFQGSIGKYNCSPYVLSFNSKGTLCLTIGLMG